MNRNNQLDAGDGLRYFIVALPETSMYLLCTTSETEGEVVHEKLIQAPSNSLLTVSMR